MKYFLLFSVLLWSACSSAPQENRVDSAARSSADDTSRAMNKQVIPRSTLLDTVAEGKEKKLIRPSEEVISEIMREVMPLGWDFLDTATGDLNHDQYLDMLMILREESDSLGRPLLILIGDPENGFDEVARNDSVVLCYDCGGIWGDPYENMVIRNGYFSVEHYGGSSLRWSRIITFKYNEAEKSWYLHRDAGENFDLNDKEHKTTETVYNKKFYGKQKFEDYSYNQ